MRTALRLSCVILPFLAPAVAATTLMVPGGYATIQAAVDQAQNGDTIIVAPGTYAGGVLFDTKGNVRLLSSGGRAATTIAGDVELAGSSKIGVGGFTILGQVSIFCNTGTVIRDCEVANPGGSGIVIAGCPGGTYSDVRVEGNVIRANAGHGVEGELSGGKAAIAGNTIRDNSASGVSITHSYSEISGNVIHDNAGHGIAIIEGTSSMHANTIAANGGAGIHVTSGGKPFTQTIAADIAALNGTAGIFGDAGGVYDISCCDVWSNGPAGDLNYAGAISDRTGAGDNISANPLFCGPAVDIFSLMEGSPALAQSCGTMGARPAPGCAAPDAVRETAWGALKTIYK